MFGWSIYCMITYFSWSEFQTTLLLCWHHNYQHSTILCHYCGHHTIHCILICHFNLSNWEHFLSFFLSLFLFPYLLLLLIFFSLRTNNPTAKWQVAANACSASMSLTMCDLFAVCSDGENGDEMRQYHNFHWTNPKYDQSLNKKCPNIHTQWCLVLDMCLQCLVCNENQ